MKYTIEAACSCHTGKIRHNNEDNLFFDGRCLEADNTGLSNPVGFEEPLRSGLAMAVMDGMGGENYGELASYAAAREMQLLQQKKADFLVSGRKYLRELVSRMNDAVLKQKQALCTEHMGTTFVSLYFSGRYVYVCNLGDSRAYRLRSGAFQQLSKDHIEKRPGETHKAPLTQHLGISPEDMLLDPYIAKGEIRSGDRYLLCSDGLTDMLSNFEIADILSSHDDLQKCVQELIDAALKQGGRDNITVILCKII